MKSKSRVNLHPMLRAAFAASILLAAGACAQKEGEDYSEQEQQALDAWVSKYVNNRGTVAVRQENGLYVEVHEEGDGKTILEDTTAVWVRYDFTTRDLHHNVALTRYEQVARQQGTYTPYTHYCPEYIYCGPYNANLLEATYFILRSPFRDAAGQELRLRVGSNLTLYIPSQLAYGSLGTSNSAGYGGQYALKGSLPAVLDMTVREVVKNPTKAEEKQVEEYLAAHDPSRWKLLSDTLKYLYVDKTFRLPEGETTYKGDSIGADSTVNIWYVGRFIDGFVFDTNIDSVKRRVYGKVEDAGEALSFKASEKNTITAWTYVIPDLLQGQWAEMIFTSPYGYGPSGRSGAATSTSSVNNSYYMYDNSLAYAYNNFYDSYSDYSYYNYYQMMMYNQGMSEVNEETETKTTVQTEIQSYTPLIFEVYIEKNQKEE